MCFAQRRESVGVVCLLLRSFAVRLVGSCGAVLAVLESVLAAFVSPVSAALMTQSFLLMIQRSGTTFFEILRRRRPLWVSAQTGVERRSGVLELGFAPGAVRVDSWAVETVSGFACLGSGVGSGGCSCPEVHGRLGVAGSIVAQLGRVWRRRGLGLSAGLGVCASLVRSVVLCGSGAWTVRRVGGGGVRSFRMRALRRVLGVRWCGRVPGAVVGGRAGLPDVPSLVADRRRSLFGRICRLPENTPASQALQLSIEAHTGTPPAADWKRPPGHPRRNWLQQVEEDVGLSVGAAWIAGQDRSMWRTLRPSAGQAQQ